MKCPNCGQVGNNHVTDSRKEKGIVVRRRQCDCGVRFTTREFHDQFKDCRQSALDSLKDVQQTIDALVIRVRRIR